MVNDFSGPLEEHRIERIDSHPSCSHFAVTLNGIETKILHGETNRSTRIRGQPVARVFYIEAHQTATEDL